MLLTFVVFLGSGISAASIRSHVISRPGAEVDAPHLRRHFVALGAKLALAER